MVPLQYVGSGSSAVLQRAVGLLTCGTGPTQDPHVSDTRAAQLLRRSLIRQVTSKETPKQNKKWPKETRGEPTPSCANCQHPPLQWWGKGISDLGAERERKEAWIRFQEQHQERDTRLKLGFYSHFKMRSKQSYVQIKESKNLSGGRSKGATLWSSSCVQSSRHLYTENITQRERCLHNCQFMSQLCYIWRRGKKRKFKFLTKPL